MGDEARGPHLDPRLLAAFVAAAQQGSVGRAAIALGLTQPAVSRSLKQLERLLGASLFERHAKGLRPTVFGEALLPHAELILSEGASAVGAIAELRGQAKGVARIGIVASVAVSLLPAAVSHLRATRPGIRVKVNEDIEDRLSAALARGEIDLAVATEIQFPAEMAFDHEILFRDLTAVTLRRGHPLLARPVRAVADLAGQAWVMPPQDAVAHRELARRFAACGVPGPEVAVETRSISAMRALAAGSDLLCWLPETIVKVDAEAGRLTTLSLAALEWRRELRVFRRRRGTLPPAAVAMLQALRRVTMA